MLHKVEMKKEKVKASGRADVTACVVWWQEEETMR
jgi:hypothetical protein